MPNSFIAKITPRGGPYPALELDELVASAEEQDPQRAWFATRQPGRRLQIDGESRVLIVGPVAGRQPVEAVFAKIVATQDHIPQDPGAQELYETPDEFSAWWQLENPRRLRLQTLAVVPGCQVDSRNIADVVLRGRPSFTYWEFPEDVDGMFEGGPGPSPPSQPLTRRPPGGALPATVPPTALEHPREGVRLYGVDFSGGREDERGNPKIWIAEWYLDAGWLALTQGTDAVRLRRRDLPTYIADRGGWWTIDFPFGIAAATAGALGIGDHGDWLNLCAGHCVQEDGATQLRDFARRRTAATGVPWSLRRQIDDDNATTWFPLFQQLYRQTICGAGEVLASLKKRSDISILPWDDVASNNKAIVAEGFPGVTLRTRLGLVPTGYKGRRQRHRDARCHILDRLGGEPFALPINDEIRQRAADDIEGDAVDALLLLVATSVSRSIGAHTWSGAREALAVQNATVEGWFPS